MKTSRTARILLYGLSSLMVCSSALAMDPLDDTEMTRNMRPSIPSIPTTGTNTQELFNTFSQKLVDGFTYAREKANDGASALKNLWDGPQIQPTSQIPSLEENASQSSGAQVNVSLSLSESGAQPTNITITPNAIKIFPSDAVVKVTVANQKAASLFKIPFTHVEVSKQGLTNAGIGAVALITVAGVTYVLYKNGTLQKLGTTMKQYPRISAAALLSLCAAVGGAVYCYVNGITVYDLGKQGTDKASAAANFVKNFVGSIFKSRTNEEVPASL